MGWNGKGSNRIDQKKMPRHFDGANKTEERGLGP